MINQFLSMFINFICTVSTTYRHYPRYIPIQLNRYTNIQQYGKNKYDTVLFEFEKYLKAKKRGIGNLVDDWITM